MESAPQSYTTLIDKVVSTVSIKAQKGDNTVIPTNTYVNSGLKFTLTQGTVGLSGADFTISWTFTYGSLVCIHCAIIQINFKMLFVIQLQQDK